MIRIQTVFLQQFQSFLVGADRLDDGRFPFIDRFKNSRFFVQLRLLRQVTDTIITGHVQAAGIRGFDSRDDLQQGTFAGSVLADQTDMFTFADREGYFIEEFLHPVGFF
ncbi:hypothetical protein SDC9_101472 [bioreactor metagenome]|uniref:Uncharacterized protein n=1 Tax=bioreactor metagenome TaxID=1076179 RepID=A0A645AUW9_9ZZZZ